MPPSQRTSPRREFFDSHCDLHARSINPFGFSRAFLPKETTRSRDLVFISRLRQSGRHGARFAAVCLSSKFRTNLLRCPVNERRRRMAQGTKKDATSSLQSVGQES